MNEETIRDLLDVSKFKEGEKLCGLLINLTPAEFGDLEAIRLRLNVRAKPTCNAYAQRSAVVALALSRLLVDLERGEIR